MHLHPIRKIGDRMTFWKWDFDPTYWLRQQWKPNIGFLWD